MSVELLVNVTPSETRVALVENGLLQEVHVERQAKRGIVGNIYKGKISRVLPGMQAAFVDIGHERTAFLHVNDLVWPKVAGERERSPLISELLHEGQAIVAQVMKDMMGTKGARLTTDLSIPSRYLVYMPCGEHIGVSQRIEDEAERDRLKTLIRQLREESAETRAGGGFIVRTVAEGVSAEELRRDMQYLVKLWRWVQDRSGRMVVAARSVCH